MADNILKTIGLEFQAKVTPAISGISKLISKIQELRGVSNDNNIGQGMSGSITKAAKESISAIEAQKNKIESLKQTLQSVETEYANIAARAREAKSAAATYKSTVAENSKRFDIYSDVGRENAEKMAAIKMELEAEIREINEAADSLRQQLSEYGIDTEQNLEDAVAEYTEKIKQSIKEEEDALKDLQQAEQDATGSQKEGAEASKEDASETAKAAASKSKFAMALKVVKKAHQTTQKATQNAINTLKKFKSAVDSIRSKLPSFGSGLKGIGNAFKKMLPSTKNLGGAFGKLLSTFKRLFVMRVLRMVIMNIINAFKEGVDNVVRYSAALNNLDANHANQTMSELASTGQYLKNVLGSAVIPVLNALLPIIRSIATAFATAVNYVNQFMSALGGKSTWTRAKQVTVDYASTLDGVGSSAGGATDKVEELKRTILGFDEINKLEAPNDSGTSGGGGSGSGGSDSVNYEDMFEEVPIENDVLEFLSKIKEELGKQQPYIDGVKDAWGRVKDAIKDLFESQGFKYLVGEVFRGALITIEGLLSNSASFIGTITGYLNNGDTQQKITDVVDAWEDFNGAVKDLFESEGFKYICEKLGDVVLIGIKGLIGDISQLIIDIKEDLDKLKKADGLSGFEDAWGRIFDAIDKLFKSEGFKYIISEGFKKVMETLAAAAGALASGIDTFGEVLSDPETKKKIDKLSEAWSGLLDSVEKLVESQGFKDLLSEATQTALSGMAGYVTTMKDGVNTINGVLGKKEIQDEIGNIGEKWEDAWEAVDKLMTSPSFQKFAEEATYAGLTTIEGFLGSFTGVLGGFQRALDEQDKNGNLDRLGDAWGRLAGAVSGLFNSEGFQSLESTLLGNLLIKIEGKCDAIANIIEQSVIPTLDTMKENGSFQKLSDAFSNIWKAVDDISKSELFKFIIGTTLEGTLGIITGAMDAIAGAFQIIDGVLSGDFNKAGQGLRKVVAGILELFTPLFSAIDKFFGTDLVKQNNAMTRAVAENTTYQQAWYELYGAHADNVYNDEGEDWAVDARLFGEGSGWIVFPERDTFRQKLAEWKRDVWDTLPLEDRELELQTFVKNNAKELAVYSQDNWKILTQEEKQLAFDAYIASLPADVAEQFMRGHGTAPSWANLTDEERLLAFAALINTPGALVAGQFTSNEWKNLSDEKKILAFQAWIESKGVTVAEAFESAEWSMLSDKDKELLFNAGIETKPKTVAEDYKTDFLKEKNRKLEFEASTGTNAPKRLLQEFQGSWGKLSGRNLPYNATISTAASTLRNNYKTSWNNLSASTKKLAFASTISTGASSLATTYKNVWKNDKSDKKLAFTSTISTGASSLVTTYKGVWKNDKSDKKLPFESTISTGAATLRTNYRNDAWNKLTDRKLNFTSAFSTSAASLRNNFRTNDWNKLEDRKLGFNGKIDNLWSMRSDFETTMDGASFSATATVDAKIVELYSDTVLTFKEGRLGELFTGGIVGRAMGGLVSAASGRFFDSAQMFLARENGIPEYVGRFGSHAAVANNYQITTGIAMGVSEAMVSQNMLLQEQNNLLREIANKDTSLNTSTITSGLTRRNQRAGRTLVPVY